jgi:hypothetical protein
VDRRLEESPVRADREGGLVKRGWVTLVTLLGPAAFAAGPPAGPGTGLTLGGEQELPKVLYVVPWKDPAPGEPAPAPVIRLDEGFLAPVNRDAFRRQLQYQAGLIGRLPAQPPAPTAR